MKAVRIALYSIVLTATNFTGIIVGFVAFLAIGATNQLAVQLPTAVACSLLVFAVWAVLARSAPFKPIAIKRRGEFMFVFLGSLVWSTIVFVPLHYFTQGYLTSGSNIAAIWLFQLPVNLFAVTLARQMAEPGGKGGRSPRVARSQ